MGMAEAFLVMNSYGVCPNKSMKAMLVMMANFCDEKRQGWVSNAALARAGELKEGSDQVRKYKRRMERLGFATFDNQRGRGRSQHFKIDLSLFEKTPQKQGVSKNTKTPHFLPKTPHLPHENPSPIRGANQNKDILGQSDKPIDTNDAPSGALDMEARRLRLAAHDRYRAKRELREWLVQDFGISDDWLKSYYDALKPKSITAGSGFVLQASSAFRMGKLLDRLGNLFESLDVRLTHG